MSLIPATKLISDKFDMMPKDRSLLVGFSGIDTSGKGYVTAKLSERLRAQGLNIAIINVDGWLNLPNIRFGHNNLAKHFYKNAIRFDEMFLKLVMPLRDNRSIKLIADFAEETANEFRKHVYCFENIDVILLEGIFLFKKKYQNLFDLKIWIECSFRTALKRAIDRSQEGLPEMGTIGAYETIYFPAQRIHFERDRPKETVNLILPNDL